MNFTKNNFLKYFGTIIVSFFLIFSVLKPIKAEAAPAPAEFTGYAWADTIGWISLNCSNTSSCGNSNYKVVYDTTTGDISGYAWADSVGWVQFGVPSGATINLDSTSPNYGKLSGWALVLSMQNLDDNESSDWGNGWISLSSSSGTSYAVSFNMTTGNANPTAYAWGSNVIGWVNFAAQAHIQLPVFSGFVTLKATNVASGQTSQSGILTVNSGEAFSLSSTGAGLDTSVKATLGGNDSIDWTNRTNLSCPSSSATPTNYSPNITKTNNTGATVSYTYIIGCKISGAGNTSSTVTVNVLPVIVTPTLPVVTTMNPVINIASITATGGGTLNSDGGSPIIDSGIVWNVTVNPTTTSSMGSTNHYNIANGFSWTDPMTGFLQCTTYHVRAYAKNAVGISYGADVSFTTLPSGATCAGPSSVVILDGRAGPGEEVTPVHAYNVNGIPETMTVKSGATVTLFSKGQNVSTMNASFNNAESDDAKNWNGHKLCPTSMAMPTTYAPSFVVDNPTNQIISYYYRISCLNSVGGVIASNDFIINILPDICAVKPNDPACTNSRALLRVYMYDTSGSVGNLLETAEGNTSPGPLEQIKTITINQGEGVMLAWSKHNVASKVTKTGSSLLCSLGKDNGPFGFSSASFDAEYPIWGYDITTSDFPMYDTLYTLSCYAPAPGSQNMKASIQVKVIPAPSQALLRIKDENGNVLATAIANSNNPTVTEVVTQPIALSGHAFPMGWNQNNITVTKGVLRCSLHNDIDSNWGFSSPSFTPSLPFNWGEPIDNNPVQNNVSTLTCIDATTGTELKAIIDFNFSNVPPPPPGGDVMTLTSNNDLSCGGNNGFLSYYVESAVSDKELSGCRIDILDPDGKPVTPPSPMSIPQRSTTLSFSMPANNSSDPINYDAILRCDATKNKASAVIKVNNCQPEIISFEGAPTCTDQRSSFFDWQTDKMDSCKIQSFDSNMNLVTEEKVDVNVSSSSPYEANLVDKVTYFKLNCDDGSGNFNYFAGPIKVTNVIDLKECSTIQPKIKTPIYKER